MIPRAQRKALWFGRSHHDGGKKKKKKTLPSYMDGSIRVKNPLVVNGS
jgi:hypothetical protein